MAVTKPSSVFRSSTVMWASWLTRVVMFARSSSSSSETGWRARSRACADVRHRRAPRVRALGRAARLRGGVDRAQHRLGFAALVFGGRVNTPICGDAQAFHPAGGVWAGKNALYFGGRVQKAKLP